MSSDNETRVEKLGYLKALLGFITAIVLAVVGISGFVYERFVKNPHLVEENSRLRSEISKNSDSRTDLNSALETSKNIANTQASEIAQKASRIDELYQQVRELNESLQNAQKSEIQALTSATQHRKDTEYVSRLLFEFDLMLANAVALIDEQTSGLDSAEAELKQIENGEALISVAVNAFIGAEGGSDGSRLVGKGFEEILKYHNANPKSLAQNEIDERVKQDAVRKLKILRDTLIQRREYLRERLSGYAKTK